MKNTPRARNGNKAFREVHLRGDLIALFHPLHYYYYYLESVGARVVRTKARSGRLVEWPCWRNYIPLNPRARRRRLPRRAFRLKGI